MRPNSNQTHYYLLTLILILLMALKVSFAVVVLSSLCVSCTAVMDPTIGFTNLPFNSSHYKIHKPYDVPETQRHSFVDGVHRLWVYSTDHPFSKGSPTNPRTEIMINGYIYNSGIWQFEGEAFVPNGTNGACITQVFGAGYGRNTTLMLDVYNGSLMYYTYTTIVPNIMDRWFKVNVIHDVEASLLKVFIDGALLLHAGGREGTCHFFKFGVYGQNNESYYMESRWRGIRVLYKDASPAPAPSA
ncbi:Citrate-binding protein [Linum grandiflorum]